MIEHLPWQLPVRRPSTIVPKGPLLRILLTRHHHRKRAHMRCLLSKSSRMLCANPLSRYGAVSGRRRVLRSCTRHEDQCWIVIRWGEFDTLTQIPIVPSGKGCYTCPLRPFREPAYCLLWRRELSPIHRHLIRPGRVGESSRRNFTAGFQVVSRVEPPEELVAVSYLARKRDPCSGQWQGVTLRQYGFEQRVDHGILCEVSATFFHTIGLIVGC